MRPDSAMAALGALAHAHRLAIYRLLVQRGPEGLPAGAIGQRVGLVPSSLTFHLQALHRAGLITQAREGRQLIYAANFALMNELVAFLTENCCVDADACTPDDCSPTRSTKKRRSAA